MYATNAYSASVTYTPAATSHTALDAVGAVGEYVFLNRDGAPPPPGQALRVTSATLQINGGTIETTAWRVHLYTVTPPSAYADDAAWDISNATDLTSYLGYVDLSQVIDLGTTLYIDMPNLNKQFKLAAGKSSVFGYLVNGTTLSTQAAAHIVTLHVEAV